MFVKCGFCVCSLFSVIGLWFVLLLLDVCMCSRLMVVSMVGDWIWFVLNFDLNSSLLLSLFVNCISGMFDVVGD